MVFPPNLSARTKNLIAIAAKVDSVTILRGLKWWERIPHATCYPCFQTFQAFWWCGHCLVFSSVRIYILSKKRKIGYLIQNPKSKIQNPKSKIQNPKDTYPKEPVYRNSITARDAAALGSGAGTFNVTRPAAPS